MRLDIRTPIGLMFSILGGLLLVYGVVTVGDAALYERSLGINVNAWWGAVLLAFGALMLWLGRTRPVPPRPTGAPTEGKSHS